jgi:putative heme iron utilization protein
MKTFSLGFLLLLLPNCSPFLSNPSSSSSSHPRGKKCSLFIQAPTNPARSVGRLTLVGSLETVASDDKVVQRLAERREPFGAASSAPAPQVYRLNVEAAHLSSGLTPSSEPLAVDAAVYHAAGVDALVGCAAALSVQMNDARQEDLIRIASWALHVSFDDVDAADMQWVDQYGSYLRVLSGGQVRTVRVPFERPVRDDRDARSSLTMLAQKAWEVDKQYAPVIPEALLAGAGAAAAAQAAPASN